MLVLLEFDWNGKLQPGLSHQKCPCGNDILRGWGNIIGICTCFIGLTRLPLHTLATSEEGKRL